MWSGDTAQEHSNGPRLLGTLAAGLAGVLAAALFLGVSDGGPPWTALAG